MKHILAVDIGNTNIAVGLFRDCCLIRRASMPTHNCGFHARCLKSLLQKCRVSLSEVECVIISSVVPVALSRLVCELNRMGPIKIMIIGRDIKVPIKNLYKIKSEVGQDRLVNAYAAKVIYGAPSVIVDFGTAITFDIVSKKGEYLGGLILPGIEMSLKSLYQKTALLPRVELKEARSVIGRDTVDSMRGGILFGFGAMCDGLTEQYRKMLGGKMKVLATGGNANLIKRYAGSIQVVDENITLKGISLLAEHACGKRRRDG